MSHHAQLALLLWHHREVVETRFNVNEHPQVRLPLLINDLQQVLDWIAGLPCVRIELYKVAAEAVVLPLLPLLN